MHGRRQDQEDADEGGDKAWQGQEHAACEGETNIAGRAAWGCVFHDDGTIFSAFGFAAHDAADFQACNGHAKEHGGKQQQQGPSQTNELRDAYKG